MQVDDLKFHLKKLNEEEEIMPNICRSRRQWQGGIEKNQSSPKLRKPIKPINQ
jgi:hypothetical protein